MTRTKTEQGTSTWGALLTGLLLTVSACGYSSAGDAFGYDPGAGGSYGATPGGQKDIAQARALIAAGRVPAPGMITVEGLLSEHDLPVSGPPCDATFCARPAAAYAPSLSTGQNELFLHVGMASNRTVTRDSRPPLDIIAVVDKSAAMSIDMVETNGAVADIVRNLKPGDRFAELTFDDKIHTQVPLGEVRDVAATQALVRSVTASGGSQLVTALQTGYELAAANLRAGRLSRIMLFTCGYPGIEGRFSDLNRIYADRGIALSMFGILLSFDAALAAHIGELRGGNYYFLQDLQKITKLFTDDFDLIVTPLAYDLRMQLALSTGLSPAAAYGLPGGSGGAPGLDLTVKSVFPSRSHGGIVLRLAGRATDPATMGHMGLTYIDVPSGTASDGGMALPKQPAQDAVSYDSVGAHKAVVLVNEATSLIDITDRVGQGDITGAKAKAQALRAYLATETASLADPALVPELTLVDQLLTLL